MRRFLVTTLSLIVLAAAFTTVRTERAEARRGGAIAAGIALGIIGGVVLHRALRDDRRGYYRPRYRTYSYRPVYYRSYMYGPAYRNYYYRPVYRTRVYRTRIHRRAPRCIIRYGRRYCR